MICPDFKRISHPMDLLTKRQALYAGEVMHEFYGLPGKYISQGPTELLGFDNKKRIADDISNVLLDGEEVIFNHEDESNRVDYNILKKNYQYKRNGELAFQKPVIPVITTPAPLNKCILSYSPTICETYTPLIVSFTSHYDGVKRLNNMTTLINDYRVPLNKVTAMNIVVIPRMFNKNNDLVTKKVGDLFQNMKLEDESFRTELAYELECIAHKFIQNVDEIKKFEKVINLDLAQEDKNYQSNKSFAVYKNTFKAEGYSEGKLYMAYKILEKWGIDEAVEISGLSREDILNFNPKKKFDDLI